MEAPEGGSNWRLVELRPVSEGIQLCCKVKVLPIYICHRICRSTATRTNTECTSSPINRKSRRAPSPYYSSTYDTHAMGCFNPQHTKSNFEGTHVSSLMGSIQILKKIYRLNELVMRYIYFAQESLHL